MKILRIVIPLICCAVLIYLNSGCERDDICAEDTRTTPLLIIKFIDYNSGLDLKKPNELQVKAISFENVLDFTTNQDSIMIPLRTDASLTNFEFTINSDTTDEGNETPNTDLVGFEYTTEQEYVSSACGFRVNYKGLTGSFTKEENSVDNWIKRITIEEDNVTNETAAHVFIYH